MVVQPGLCRTWSETPKTDFLTTRLVLCKWTVCILSAGAVKSLMNERRKKENKNKNKNKKKKSNRDVGSHDFLFV